MFTPESYSFVISLLPRLLGFIYLFAFGAFIYQIKGLIGKNGILPVADYFDALKKQIPSNRLYILVPSLFWINCSDKALVGVVWVGTILSFLLMMGFYPALILFLLYFLYLSILWAGQDFLSFGWEGFLLEITFNVFFLSLSSTPNLMMWISLNLVLFRFHLQAGAVKLQSRDPNWRNLTGVAFHYQSQPIPNTTAWYAYKLPMWFHKTSTFLMLFIEIILPFGMFGTDLMRLWVFFAFVGLQWAIWLTGNFSYLNYLTVVLSTILVANVYIPEWLMGSFDFASPISSSGYVDFLCTCVGTLLIILHGVQIWQHFVPNPLFHLWLGKIRQFFISNRYGIFAVMTTDRIEIIFEGSNDGIEWREYTFYHKPSQVNKRPKRISPIQPRLDWQVWFLPFGHFRYDEWVGNFIFRLLEGRPEVLRLIEGNPFPESPPKFIRSSMYRYTFTTFEEKRKTGNWWNREYIGTFSRPLQLSKTF